MSRYATKRICTPWTEHEMEILASNYEDLGARGCIALLPGRTVKSITSMACMIGVKERVLSNIERFETKFRVTPGCWIWKASLTTTGYGQFAVSGRMQKAHRVSYEIYNGSHPGPLAVLHKCDNPTCVNPDHLFLGTQADNMLDMSKKKRSTIGEKCAASKLTDDEVIAIRGDVRPNAIIAAEYSISNQQVSRIKRRENWRHL